MPQIGKVLILCGIVMLSIGCFLVFLNDKLKWFGDMPLDFSYESDSTHFFAPIGSKIYKINAANGKLEKKFGNEGFVGWISSMGIPGELALIIALAEVIPGILLIIGVLNRISASIISIIMVGAIFHVKGAESLTGDKGIEFDLILLAAALIIIVAGPGRISLSQIIKKIPRCLH